MTGFLLMDYACHGKLRFLGLDLDGLAAETHLASHAAKRVLLLRLAPKPEQKFFTSVKCQSKVSSPDGLYTPDKPVPFAESRLIQNNLSSRGDKNSES